MNRNEPRYYGDDRALPVAQRNFDNDSDRQHFILRVFLIVMSLMGFIFAGIAICALLRGAREKYINFLERYWILPLISGIVVIIIILVFVCDTRARRQKPVNYILLVVLTLCMAVIYILVAASCTTSQIVTAIGAVLLIFLAVTFFGLVVRLDIFCLAFLQCIVAIQLFILLIVSIFVVNYTMIFLLCLVAVLLFSLFIVSELKVVKGENPFLDMHPQDDAFCAYFIFFSYMVIFYIILYLAKVTEES